MDSSESPTYGEQEGSAYNGHFGGTCYRVGSVREVLQKPLRRMVMVCG
jgi:hypothetical protein